MSNKIFLTKEGYERLNQDLKVLKGQKRREIADALEKARALGDLSENAEYESAKQAQELNEIRIRELEEKLSKGRILDNENISSDKVYIGAKVKLLDMDSKEEMDYTIVSQEEADFESGKISVTSPIGKALLGKAKEEIVNIKIPAGFLKYKVIDISR